MIALALARLKIHSLFRSFSLFADGGVLGGERQLQSAPS